MDNPNAYDFTQHAFGDYVLQKCCSRSSLDFDGVGDEGKLIENDVDKLYKAIMDNSHSYCDMEKALDHVGLPLTTPLVVRVLDILSCTRYKVKQFRIVCDLLDYTKTHDKNNVPVEYLQKFAKKKRIRAKTQPEINALNLLLDALCKCSLVQDAQDMLRRVRKKVKPDANTYNNLFFGWCRVRNLTRGMRLLEETIQEGHTPDNFTYTTAIDAFCKNMSYKGWFLRQLKFLNSCERKGCLAGKVVEACKFLQEMGNKGYPPDIVTYNCFLKVLCNNNKRDEALRLYGRMIDGGCMPSVQTYNMLISMYFEMSDPDGAFETWHEMDKRGCAQDTVEDACCLLEDVVNKEMKLPYSKFDSFLMELSVVGDLRSIHRLSSRMRKFYNPSMARHFALNQKRKSMSLRES
ncbi:pentatricopeptide repeat-containing protein At1g73400, mitochondrial-like [Pyrus communis]|uniref:pentatricopeptide repeat-containing protein At1g73400, mitochondrial-like n=1 Tax=Pyrus communis TaxID=23211 RepID=UPI0035BECE2E